MTPVLRRRFFSAEEQFCSAFASGEEAIAAFDTTWASLRAEYASAIKQGLVDDETMSLADTVACRIAVLAYHFLSLHIDADDACESFDADCRRILAHADTLKGASAVLDPPSPPLDCLGGAWLLQNLHDPYPSTETRASIAEASNSSLKSVQDWFADARRRIGWTTLSTEKFGGSRRATSDAASLAYEEHVGDIDLQPSIRRAFNAIKVNVDRLYGGRSCLDDEDGTFGTVTSQMSDAEGGTSTTRGTSHFSQVALSDIAHSLPSSTLLMDEEEEDTTPPPPLAGCKRRSDISVEAADASPTNSRPLKRHRHTAGSSDLYAQAYNVNPLEYSVEDRDRDSQNGLDFALSLPSATGVDGPRDIHSSPSGAPSAGSISFAASHPVSGSITTAQEPIARILTSTRKRRLSDTSCTPSPKRPRSQMSGPRMQTVSDPLPARLTFPVPTFSGIDDYLQSDFTLTAADKEAFNPYLNFDVELATCSNTDNKSALVSYPGALSPTAYLDVCDADLASASAGSFDFSMVDLPHLLTDFTTYSPSSSTETPSNSSGTSSPSSSSSSDLDIVDGPAYLDSAQNWTEFMNILDSLGSSPTPSTLSILDHPPPSHLTSSVAGSSESNDFFRTLGADPSFTSSDLLSDIGEVSSLYMPLEAIL